jgi:methylase of polypeptide subunit release factors
MKTKAVLREARRALASSPLIEHYAGQEAIESEELLAEALGHPESVPSEIAAADVRRFESLLTKRLEGDPVAVIRGWEGFRGLRVGVRPGVFVPRQSSELLAEQPVRRLRARKRPIAVDVATGAPSSGLDRSDSKLRTSAAALYDGTDWGCPSASARSSSLSIDS